MHFLDFSEPLSEPRYSSTMNFRRIEGEKPASSCQYYQYHV